MNTYMKKLALYIVGLAAGYGVGWYIRQIRTHRALMRQHWAIQEMYKLNNR